MKEKKWQGLRESGFRVFFVGFFSLVIAFLIYSRLTMPSSELLRVESDELIRLAYGMLAITAASIAAMLYGAYIIFCGQRSWSVQDSLDSLISFITRPISGRDY